MLKMACGFFIALEGIDGAGTTSQMQPVAEALHAAGYGVTLTCEPSQGPTGVLLRQALKGAQDFDEAAMALLFAADRLHHVTDCIGPALARGDVVITDRYLMSSLAYQSTALGLDWVKQINSHAPWPGAHLMFDVSCETAQRRRQARGGPAERFDADARQQAVAAGYRALCEGPDALADVYRIDAEQSMPDVTQSVVACISALLTARRIPKALSPQARPVWP